MYTVVHDVSSTDQIQWFQNTNNKLESVHKIYFAMDFFFPILNHSSAVAMRKTFQWVWNEKVCKIHLHTENFQSCYSQSFSSAPIFVHVGQWSSLLCHSDALNDLEHSWKNQGKRRRLIMEVFDHSFSPEKYFTWSTDNKHKQTQEPWANRGGIFIGFLNQRNSKKKTVKNYCWKT